MGPRLEDSGSDRRKPRAHDLPAARVVNSRAVRGWRGAEASSWRRRAQRALDRAGKPLQPVFHTVAIYVVGFFPLWLAVGLATAFLWFAGLRGSP